MNHLKTLGNKAKEAGTTALIALQLAVMNPAAVLTTFAAEATDAADAAGTTAATGDTASLDQVTSPIISLLKSVTNVLIPLVGALGAIYCVILGVKFAKAEEPQEREKAKTNLRNAIIGYVLIFVLIVVLNRLTPVMQDWMAKSM